MKLTLALFAVLGVSPLVQLQTQAQAQTDPHTPPTPAAMAQHRVTRYTTLLSLTPPQVEQATTIFTTEATAASTQRTTEHAAHQAMEAAIKTNDTATIQTTATSMGQLAGEMMAAHANARAQFYALLNADQKAKYLELEEEHRMGGPMHGPPMR